ncbi:hypothetical protein [Bradyrhizobium sp. TM233]|uniref:hypothetical protein n=1 Tax=Bradyrhizobium sp. TM233 TaxID=2599801 RepID=UPI0027D5EE16|nr:hypothetical protein TM233_45310 [Bradyrhizobium sp. TM233]
MPDAEMVSLLRTVLDEVCADVAPSDTAIRERVAAKLREAAQAAPCSIEDLRRAGRIALTRAPTMWR